MKVKTCPVAASAGMSRRPSARRRTGRRPRSMPNVETARWDRTTTASAEYHYRAHRNRTTSEVFHEQGRSRPSTDHAHTTPLVYFRGRSALSFDIQTHLSY